MPMSAAFPSVSSVGGGQPDLAAARNLCTSAGIAGPDGAPLSEAMAFGLAGGVGFLYGVFAYADGPTMTIVARNRSMPDPFCEPLFAAAGADAHISMTGSQKKASAALDEAIADERPALCTVGSGALSYTGEIGDMAARNPHIVGVVGATEDEVLVDDRSPSPIVVPRPQFDAARTAAAGGNHRMIRITSIDTSHDWPTAIEAAVHASADGFNTPPVPQFASNVGLRGLSKFAGLLTARNAKGWPRVFDAGPNAAVGLTRLHDCIEHAYTSSNASRPLQAGFLTEAAAITGNDTLTEAAQLFAESAQCWAAIASIVRESHPMIERHVDLSDERAARQRAQQEEPSMAQLATHQRQAVNDCDLTATAAAETYRDISDQVHRILELESRALDCMVPS